MPDTAGDEKSPSRLFNVDIDVAARKVSDPAPNAHTISEQPDLLSWRNKALMHKPSSSVGFRVFLRGEVHDVSHGRMSTAEDQLGPRRVRLEFHHVLEHIERLRLIT